MIKIHTQSPQEYGEKVFSRRLDSDLSLKNTCLDEILAILQEKHLLDEEESSWARLCIDEVLVNAIVHGNKEEKSKKVDVALFVTPQVWSIRVEDEGEGFKTESLPQMNSPDYEEAEHGRGIILLQGYMDEIWYYDKGNRVQITKYKRSKLQKILHNILAFFHFKK